MADMSKAEAKRAQMIAERTGTQDLGALKDEALATVTEDGQPAKPRLITVEFGGHEYKVRADCMTNIEALEYQMDQNFLGMVRTVLGPQQWNQWKARNRDPDGYVRGFDPTDPEGSPIVQFTNKIQEAVDPTNG